MTIKNSTTVSTVPVCRVRTHTNFLTVLNRTSMRLSVRGRHGQPDGRRAAVHGAGRMTCLDSGTLDTGLKFEAKKG